MSVSDREERVEEYYHQSARELAEQIVDLEDGIKTFIELDDARLKEIEKLKKAVKMGLTLITPLQEALSKAIELDPSRLESALRMYVAELDYDIHKGIENGEEDGLDHYPEEVDYFLRCWETAGEG
ncbi:hypothetical protein ABZ154_09055 [Streptomyces sp. NPDC006261]|uniref:hypothetical protein n=1 Tax=Streptomyces sp. NPDC006261 TaxID=3156739 RepID=UPI00339F89B3